MRCIFCKKNSNDSKSVEHIVPESLGNIEYVLPRGIVCDNCNNYFSRKIEKHLLDSNYFVHARFRNTVYSKKGRIPIVKGVHAKSATIIEVSKGKNGFSVYPLKKKDEERFKKSLLDSKEGQFFIPVPTKINEYLFSRFLGKIAIEALAKRFLGTANGVDELIDKTELDKLRNYVRYGNPKENWSFYQRRIYPEGALFTSEDSNEDYEVLHEFGFLHTPSLELYFILVIFGIEYTLNMGDPDIEGYITWLKKNRYKSPLYMKGINYKLGKNSKFL